MMPKSNIPMPPPNSGTPAMGGGGAPGEGGMPDLNPDQAKELITQAAQQLKKLGEKYGVDVVAIMSGGGDQPQPEMPPQQ